MACRCLSYIICGNLSIFNSFIFTGLRLPKNVFFFSTWLLHGECKRQPGTARFHGFLPPIRWTARKSRTEQGSPTPKQDRRPDATRSNPEIQENISVRGDTNATWLTTGKLPAPATRTLQRDKRNSLTLPFKNPHKGCPSMTIQKG